MVKPTQIAESFLAGRSIAQLSEEHPDVDIESSLRAHFMVNDTGRLRCRLDSLVEALELLARQSDHVDLRFTELIDEARDG